MVFHILSSIFCAISKAFEPSRSNFFGITKFAIHTLTVNFSQLQIQQANQAKAEETKAGTRRT